jgi:nucleoside 2-deoxyribosyltransferase
MKKITISCSLRFKDLIKKTIEDFRMLGIEAKFPNLESGPEKNKLTIELMTKIENEHFESISESEALYVINPNGYIGTLVTAEIGYAIGNGKPVYYSEKTNSIDLDAMATDFIALNKLSKIVDL